jgi:kumamolisin
LFLSALVKGITVIVASGDSGARAQPSSADYTVQYPASSPFVLSCGGTVVADRVLASEAVWNAGSAGSGGGVSQIYAVPAYQQNLTTKKYPSGAVASITGRAVPDVGGHAVGYQFYFGPGPAPSGTLQNNGSGTSAVAPVYAGLIGRINQAIAGRCGFVNKFMYANPGAFHDVTQGNNAGPGLVGYSATPGWDACTGLGSPNGIRLLQAVVNQPAVATTPTVLPGNRYGSRPTTGQTYPRNKISQTA